MPDDNRVYKSLHEIAIDHGLPKPGDSNQVFWVPDPNYANLESRIAWLNVRAVKLSAVGYRTLFLH